MHIIILANVRMLSKIVASGTFYFCLGRKKAQHIATQRNDELRIEYTREFSYLPAHMIPYVDETGNDRHSDCRKCGYH